MGDEECERQMKWSCWRGDEEDSIRQIGHRVNSLSQIKFVTVKKEPL